MAAGTNSDRVKTGIAGLDAILCGGLTRDRVYLLEGLPGTGKTTAAMQFLLEGARCGEASMLVTQSETDTEIREIAASHGWSLEGVTVYEWNADSAAEAAYTIFPVSEIELGQAVTRLLAEVERVRPRRLVIDSIVGLRMLAPEDSSYRRQIEVLRRFFMAHSCTVLLIDDSLDGDARAQTMAHGVIQLQNIAQVYGPERRQLRVLKMRGIAYLGGFHDFAIRRGGLQVHPRLVAEHHVHEFPADDVTTGNAELDSLLGGGLRRGTSTLVIGPAGVGKSTLASVCAVAAARRGESATLLFFDEVEHTWRARLESLGIEVADILASGRLRVQRLDPGQVSPGWLSDHMMRSVQEGVRLVVLDSVNGYLQAMAEERFVAMHLRELLTFLDQAGLVTLLTMSQHGMLGPGQITPIDVSYLADTVLLLRYFETAGEIRQALSVIKKRTGRHERTIREMRIGRGGIEIGEALREFSGVLTGVPAWHGNDERLMKGAVPRSGTRS
jgi:circadian clock protein KaiC